MFTGFATDSSSPTSAQRAQRRHLEVILLDEPLAGVNPTMIKSLVGHILALNARHTFVIIEHNMEVVMALCRRIVVLSQGERIAEGTPAEVADNPMVLDAYFAR
jgi:ABC-type branched-subunit amino acid transport system ATPase component